MPIPLLQKIKNRKFLFFCLFLILMSFFLYYPNEAFAGVGDVIWGTTKWIFKVGLWVPRKLVGLVWDYGGKQTALAIANDLVPTIMGIIFSLATLVFGMGAEILEGVYNLDILQQPMTRGNDVIAGVVLHGWAIVRDFANMFIVLGFVVIGLATILRIREYEAQKKLLPLIITALLINFSLVITGIVIDATNITMRYFTQISRPTTIIETYKNILANDNTADAIRESIDEVGKDEKAAVAVSIFGALSIYLGVTAMVFFIYGILLLFRYVALMCLVILSPLAFVCSVFPATRPIYEKWKSQFVQWAIIGIPTAFFIYLGTYLLVSFVNAGISLTDPGSTTNPIGATLIFWVPVAFMLFAYSLIFQTSAIGAQAAIGLATGAVGYAMGASRWTAKKGVGMARESRAGQWIGSKIGRGLEAINLRAKGTTAGIEAGRNREAEKGINAITDYDELKKIAETPALTDYRRRRRAAAIDKLRKDKEWNRTDPTKRAELVNYAVSYGYSRDDYNKISPELSIHDTKEKTRLMGTTNLATGANYTQAEAEREMVAKAVKGARHDHLLDYSKETLKDYNVASALTQGQVRAYEKGSAAQVAELKAHLAALSAEEANLRAAGRNAEADKRMETFLAIDALS